MRTKVLLLEVDAGDRDLILRWAQEGALPNFQRLLQHGVSGHSMAVPGFYVGAVWPSFYTGVNPARHGIHSLVQLKPGTYEIFRCLTADHIKREPFWNYLSRAGKKVAILDVPLSGISRDLNGIQMVEWGSHDANYGFMTWPPSLADEVKARFGPHPLLDSCNADRRTPGEFQALRDTLVSGVRKKAELTRHYLRQGGWDFFAQVFTESHCVGHQCWHLHDPDHPAHEPEVAAQTGDLMKDVYVAIDTAIGDVLAELGPETTTIVLAGHGMTTKRGAQFMLHEILIRLKLAVPAEPALPAPTPVDAVDSWLTWGWQHMPQGARQLLQPVRDRLRGWIDEPAGVPAPKLDAANSKCFLVDNHFAVGAIRLNLVGREPSGKVQPGAEADALCAELKRDLLDLRDLNTGKQVISDVVLTRDLYRGDHLDDLPDVLVVWGPDMPLGTAVVGKPGNGKVRLGSKKIDLIEGENRYCRTGEHRPDGLFIASGPGLAPGALNRTVSILDFAPTITRLLDVDLPDVDGEAIREILERPGGNADGRDTPR
jgi:predicted AlkP superfamily phosphohydrolase/phosphomutase